MRTQFTFLCVLFCALVSAQDIITTTDSTTIEAIIEEVGPEQIKYRKASNPTGPLFIVYTRDIQSVTYNNGEVQTFASPTAKSQSPKQDVNFKRWFGISAAWVFRDVMLITEAEFQNMSGESLSSATYMEQTLSNALQIGFTFAPCFGDKGLGLYTGFYYERAWAMKYLSVSYGSPLLENTRRERYPKANDTRQQWLGAYGNVLYLPIHFQYRHAFNANMNTSVSLGPSFEFGLDKVYTTNRRENVNVLLGCRVGFQLYGAQISLLTDWGVRPFKVWRYGVTQNGDLVDLFRHRPISIQLSYMF